MVAGGRIKIEPPTVEGIAGGEIRKGDLPTMRVDIEDINEVFPAGFRGNITVHRAALIKGVSAASLFLLSGLFDTAEEVTRKIHEGRLLVNGIKITGTEEKIYNEQVPWDEIVLTGRYDDNRGERGVRIPVVDEEADREGDTFAPDFSGVPEDK